MMFWKIRFAMLMAFKTHFTIGPIQSYKIAESWVESFGTDESPIEAVNEELSCWGN